ncbi:MAG TPA: MFS transporter [Candidatus Saccharimonadales bacterium]|nr:MFS transporter [Candidatus Saccharimonadales bacterium]
MKREDKTIQDQAAVTNATSTADLKAGARGIAIAMYCVLLVSYILMAADRYLFPVLAPDVRKAFGFSLANTGLLSTIFTLGLGIGGLPTGYLLARYSRKMVLLTGIVIFSSATALTTMVPGFWTMLVCLAAQGIGMSMLATSMFALAASYFSGYRSAAIGSVNFCYGIGGFLGPFLAGKLRQSYNTWHAPMLAFGLFGFVMVVIIAVSVRPWFVETRRAAEVKADSGGADSLMNRNTIILTALSLIHGLGMYGFLGLYPTFLRETLHYTPINAGKVIGFFGIGALASIPCGWIGDRYSPKLVLSGSLLSIAVLGYLFFQISPTIVTREILTCIYGVTGSAVLYVNLAGYHVKALRRSMSSRGSGMFVTSLYGGAAFGGYLLGWIVGHGGWLLAAEIQMSLLSVVGAVLALALRSSEMSL